MKPEANSLRLASIAWLALSCTKGPPPRASLDLGPSETIVARVGGTPITAGQLGAQVRPRLIRVDEDYARSVRDTTAAALEELVDQQIIADRAKVLGLTVEQFLAREVGAKIPEPTEDDLKKIYYETREAGRYLPPLDQVRAQLVSHYKDQRARVVRAQLVQRLSATVKVERMLPPFLPPKVEVAAAGPWRGDPKAPVTIVEFGNYECKFSGRGENTIKELLRKYPGKLRVTFQHYPFGKQVNAEGAGMAALCAGDQGKFWEMHDKLFANQLELGPTKLEEYARDIGLEGTKFGQCMKSIERWNILDAAREAGNAAGVAATPAFFINGRALTGARPMREFEELIDHELGAAAAL